MNLDQSMQISRWKEIPFGGRGHQPQCKSFLLSSRWRLLTSMLWKYYHQCWFDSCRRYITQIRPNPIFLVRSTCSEVGINRDSKCTAWVVEHSRCTCSVYIINEIVLYAAEFIFCNQQDNWCTYKGNFHVVIIHLDDKYAQCVHCEEAKHGISHGWNVISYDEYWHI